LIAVLFAGFVGHKFKTIPRKFPKDTYILFGNKTAGNHSETKHVANPLGILVVVLAALNGFDPFGIRNGYVNGIFKQVEHGNPILPGRFHTNVPAVVFQKPSLKGEDLVIERREPPLLIIWGKTVAGNDGGYEEPLMHINAATNRVYDFHCLASFGFKKRRH
jgi:hypothetical protein